MKRNRPAATIDHDSGKPVAAPPARISPIKLDTLRNIRAELAKVYREARAGRIEAADATRLAYLLAELKSMTLAIEIEERLERLERKEFE